jgi:hypothetical protein
MKAILLILFLLAATALLADFFSPFADSAAGMTVTDSGQFIKVDRRGGTADWFIRCRTCTGERNIPAQIPANLLGSVQTNTLIKITVTIREIADSKFKARSRILEVIKIEARP